MISLFFSIVIFVWCVFYLNIEYNQIDRFQTKMRIMIFLSIHFIGYRKYFQSYMERSQVLLSVFFPVDFSYRCIIRKNTKSSFDQQYDNSNIFFELILLYLCSYFILIVSNNAQNSNLCVRFPFFFFFSFAISLFGYST